jgi:hypothetical protein
MGAIHERRHQYDGYHYNNNNNNDNSSSSSSRVGGSGVYPLAIGADAIGRPGAFR